MSVYGINSKTSGFIETSHSERGAKNHASRNGYRAVYRMCEHSWLVTLVSVFVADYGLNGKWMNPDDAREWLDKQAEKIHASNVQRANENHSKIYGTGV
jgi:hypothetical protein